MIHQSDEITVILPVYRSLAQVKPCVESLLQSARETPFRLLIIYDSGPEPEVIQYLRGCASSTNVSLVENEENVGFVKSVNIGFRLALPNDVVILNSDTVVGKKWLAKLRDAAASDSTIGTITPLSNNAEICSFPTICRNNSLPEHFTVDLVDTLMGELLPAQVVDIPTGVGFCMYIRGQALREVGLFDESAFGLGYGEENDLCQRIAKAGYRNVALINTWVYHEGGVSFGARKTRLMEQGAKIIQRRYPGFFLQVHQFIAGDPLRSWRMMAVLGLLREGPLATVLAISHGMGGGTGRHVRELSRYTQQNINIISLEPVDQHRVQVELPSWAWQEPFIFDLLDNFDMLLHFMTAAGVRLVHIHHIKGLEAHIDQLLDALRLPHLVTLHDYYLIGGNPTLSDKDGCFNPDRAFDKTLRAQDVQAMGITSLDQWQALSQRLLYEAKQVIAPDVSVADVFRRCFPGLGIVVTPHPDAERVSCYPPVSVHQRHGGAKVKVLVLGALSSAKGADLLEQVAELAARTSNLEFHLLGYAYRPLREAVVTHGPYDDDDLPLLIRALAPDFVWFPTRIAETYSYTLSAVLEAGLPLLVPDIGALANRAVGRPLTEAVPYRSDAREWFDAVREFSKVVRLHQGQVLEWRNQTPVRHYYAEDYPAVADAQPAGVGARPNHGFVQWLLAQQPTRIPTSGERLVHTLVRIRGLPGIRTLTSKIPIHLQRAVKKRLLRRPIHEIKLNPEINNR